jgi:hypothetical protein
MGLAEPVAFDQRAAFVKALAEAMAKAGVRGPGAVRRLAAQVQLSLVRTSNRIGAEESHAASALTRGARHRGTPAGIRSKYRATWF